MTEKIIQREKDRAESRKDRKRSGKVAAVAEGGQGDCSNFEQHELFVWDHNANAGYGGFVAAAMKRSRDDDEEAAEDGLAAGGPPPSQSARVDDVGGKGGSRKGKGKGKADRECFLCGQKGHFKAHCPNRWYVPKTQWSSWWNTLPFHKGKAKGKGKDQGEGGKSKGKGKDQFFYKGQGKGVGALEYPDQEPYWSEESWSAEDVAWNPIGAVSNVKTRCNVSGVLPVEKVPIRIMHKKNTAVKRQPTMKDVSKMHTTAEDTHEVEKDETNMDKEKKEVENLFAEKGWTVKVSRNRMRSRKVAKVPRSGRCDCCTSQSSRIISELSQKKVERSEKLANMVRRNSETVKLIAGLTVKQDALAPCAEKMSEWTKLSLAVDSGACESVIDAAEQVPGYEVQETRASKSGLVYASATGEEIANLGEVFLPMMTKENTKRSMKMQVAEVSRPLASVKRICEAGHVVVFDEDGSFIFNKMTGEINQLREESGNYMFDVWIPPKSTTTSFHRQ